jgi:hypothetical protein
MDLVHQQIKHEKWFKEATESSKGKTTTRENIVLEEGIFGRICQHCTTCDSVAFIFNHHLPPTSDRKQAVWEHDKRPSIRVLLNKRTRINAWGCRVHILRRDFSLKMRTSLMRFLQEKTTPRLLFERIRTRLVSPSETRETRRLSSSTMKCSEACRCKTHRVSQRYDYKSWILAWPTDRSKKGCSNCYTLSE